MHQSLTSVLIACLLAPWPARAAELIMFEQHYCEYCDAWNEDIGGIYDKTAEGKRAKLRRVDISDPHPQDLAGIRGANFTPTFVLVDAGKEVGRIRGYPGAEWFFPMLSELLERLPEPEAAQLTE